MSGLVNSTMFNVRLFNPKNKVFKFKFQLMKIFEFGWGSKNVKVVTSVQLFEKSPDEILGGNHTRSIMIQPYNLKS